MIVVSDTSPINYLLLINQVDLLPHLFERIIIPDIKSEKLTLILELGSETLPLHLPIV